MTDFSLSDWDDVGDLVERALERPAAERDGLLCDACGADEDRLARARRVLAAAERANAFLAEPAADLAADLVASAVDRPDDVPGAAPDQIGAYRILALLGRGGMGDVYLADRADDEYQRKVAIKVVRSGLGQDLIARFRHERQMLASLDHPHIAQLYDGGVTGDGRPYLVMEHVDGVPIDRYADAQALTIDQRLALFVQVCEAVERAHRRLVVHRDLKPGNILVTADGVVKLLDFGVAKLLDPDELSGDTPVTTAGMRVMTPEYASPEQFTGEPITTSTDVYALGVLLYELLAGRRPHESAGRSRTALEQAVLNDDAPAPSAVAPETRKRQLRGDLDNIVFTALRREPDRRYASVAEMRADVERHRAGLPVSARPATVRYRAGKFVRRHSVAVAASVLVTLAILGGAATTLVQARAAAREGARAEQIRDFLVSVFEISDPNQSRGEAVTARELLDRGSERIDRDLAGQPALRADMLGVMGTLYQQLGLYDRARGHFQAALDLGRAQSASPINLVDRLTSLAAVRVQDGALDEAEALLREALDIAQAEEGESGPSVAAVTSDLAAVSRRRGDFEESERLHREALAIRRAAGEPKGLASALNGLGVLLYQAGRSDEAIPVLEEAIAQARLAFGDGHTQVVLSTCNLAVANHNAGRLDEALDMFSSCVDDRRRLLGDRHPELALALNNMAMVHSDRSELEEAERLHVEALAIRRAVYGDHHTEVAGSLNNLAVLAYQREDYAGAASHFRALIDVWRDLVGPDHPNTLTTTNNLGMALFQAGELTEAERILTEALAGRRRALGDEHPDVAASLMNVSSVLRSQEAFTRAAPYAREALQRLSARFPDGHPLLATAHHELGRVLFGLRRLDQALAEHERAIEMRSEILGADHVLVADIRLWQGRTLAALGRTADAVAVLEEVLARFVAVRGADSTSAQEAEAELAKVR